MVTGTPDERNMSKRKFEDDVEAEPEVEDTAKKQRRRSSAERDDPMLDETKEPEKREVLKRLFGRYCAVKEENQGREEAMPVIEEEDNEDEEVDVLDENDDPLLDTVPVNMDPEQLGFLVCAQETLRFLYGRGFTAENPTFMRLRSRLLRGIADIAAA